MAIRFIYFDLGIVLVDFSIPQMLRQIAEVSGISSERAKAVIFDSGLQHRYESGQVTTQEFYDLFCRETDTRPPFDELTQAAFAIFSINVPMRSIAAQLQQAGWPLGILSNTCEGHWEYCFREYGMLTDTFSTHALSYKIGAVKPEAKIFHAAAELADCAPEEIFFVDDIAGHVAGAKSVGIDAVQYTTPAQFAADLRSRGIQFNY